MFPANSTVVASRSHLLTQFLLTAEVIVIIWELIRGKSGRELDSVAVGRIPILTLTTHMKLTRMFAVHVGHDTYLDIYLIM